MNRFTALYERLLDPFANDGTGSWALTRRFGYRCELLKQWFFVPAGFAHDHASVPRLPFIYANFGGRYPRSAVIHDYLCRMKVVPRDIADLIFLEAMRAENEEGLQEMEKRGATEEEISARRDALEGRATAMYAAVAAYTKAINLGVARP